MSVLRRASADEVVRLLRNGEQVRSLQISQDLDLRVLADRDYVRKPISFVDCHLPRVDISFLYFEEPVRFEGCSVGELFGMAGYFFAGLTIERCVVASRTELSCGGHNRGGHPVRIVETTFLSFVDFTDEWFEGPVFVERCTFEEGTNLLNREQLCPVRFDVPPVLEGNSGQLDLQPVPR